MNHVRIDAAQRVFERVRVVQEPVVERNPGDQGGVSQVITRDHIFRIFQRRRQIIDDELDRFARQRDRQRVRTGRRRRLDRVIQRVDARVQNLRFRQRFHQFRVVDRPGRVDAFVSDRRFVLLGRNRSDGDAVPLGAGAVRQVDRENRRGFGRRKRIRVKVFRRFPRVFEQNRDALGRVDRAPAADPDDALRPELDRDFQRFVDRLDLRIRTVFIEENVLDARRLERRGNRRPSAALFIRRRRRNDDHAVDAPRLHIASDVGDLLNRAATEINQRTRPNFLHVVQVQIFFHHWSFSLSIGVFVGSDKRRAPVRSPFPKRVRRRETSPLPPIVRDAKQNGSRAPRFLAEK